MLEPTSRIQVAIGSKNPVKIEAAIGGLAKVYPDAVIEHAGYNVPSGVSDQPFGDSETMAGAKSRAQAAFAAYELEHGRKPTFSIGLEGGVDFSITNKENLQAFAWIVAFDGSCEGCSRTATFDLPNIISKLVLGGTELGAADDIVFGTTNSKQSKGAVGFLTNGVVTRAQYYESAVILAMIPFQRRDLYPLTEQSSEFSVVA